jgi:hypothetical protein
MVKMCQFILMGPGLFVQQMGDPTTTWQSCMCFGNNNVFLALILLLQLTYDPAFLSHLHGRRDDTRLDIMPWLRKVRYGQYTAYYAGLLPQASNSV